MTGEADATLLVLAKSPVAGRVKTRLCPPCTPAQAALLAEAALADTLAAVTAVPVARRVLVLDGRPGPWLPTGFEVLPQRGGPLEERLANALVDVAGRGGRPTLVIGMDTPQVSPAVLRDALDELLAPEADAGAGAVLGPADDGGWWALGLRRPDPAAFDGVPMSTPWTGAAQRRRLEALGLAVTALPALRDVDTVADAWAVADQIPDSRFALALAALGRTTTAPPTTGTTTGALTTGTTGLAT